MGFWSASAAWETINKSPPRLIPAQDVEERERCIASLRDGNLPKHHWEMTEPDAILLTTTAEVQEQPGLSIATNSLTGKMRVLLMRVLFKSEDFCYGIA